MRPKNIFYENGRFLILKFLKPLEKELWSRELKICKKLFNEFPDMDFWNQLNLDFKLNSLAYFLTEDGQELLKNESNKNKLELPEKKVYSLDSSLTEGNKEKPFNFRPQKENNTILGFLNRE